MQTPKGRTSLEVPQRVSPRAFKTAVSESDSASPLCQASITSSEVPQRVSPRDFKTAVSEDDSASSLSQAGRTSSEVPQRVSPKAYKTAVSESDSASSLSQAGRTISEVPQRVSSRVSRQLQTAVSESDPVSSSSQAGRTPKERSPNFVERRSPRSPSSSEKKRPPRISELKSQILQLQGDLKKAKDELISSEAWRKQAEQDAEESLKHITEFSAKLEEAQRRILSSEESRAYELDRISEEKEQGWQVGLEAVKKQHFLDSSALSSALNEIHRLKNELEMVAKSETAQKEHAESVCIELESLKGNMVETESLVAKMKAELEDSRESEAQARALVNDTLSQLESAKATVEALRANGVKDTESYKSIASELDSSRARANELQGLISKLEVNLPEEARIQNTHETDKLKEEIECLKFEMDRLRSALEDAEAKNNYMENDYIRRLKDSAQREAELVAETGKANLAVEDLKARLMDKETELQGIIDENERLNSKLDEILRKPQKESIIEDMEKLKEEFLKLKATAMDKEMMLQRISDENEVMRSDIKKRDEIVVELEATRNAEKEALLKLNLVMEEVEKSNRQAARATEQLEASKASVSKMESELRRLKVQSDQWRKAAEAAAAMITVGGNGKYVDRTTSLDSRYMNGRMGSPYADDTDDDLMKKKNGNVLKKFGVLWRKPQK
ncbi:hypothetical protein MLD38_011632 [Melastoma candidum]|uniref:Uncharacterized protein n=1 Tax=Melastoma candidum TaxID=119954 RepID=A0ACB9R3P2_9MYRT|nr:hypothetical protein MLD38_011632 [Melastoma candidum]